VLCFYRAGGQGGWKPGIKGARSDRRREKRGGSGIPKMVGSTRKRGQLCNIAHNFATKNQDRAEAGIKEHGNPLSPTLYKTRSSTKRSPCYISFNNIIVFLCLFIMRVIQ